MPATICLGCQCQKRSKNDKFYSTDSVALITINNLRQKYNAKKRKLNEINDIPVASKICKSCYDLIHNNPIASLNLDNTPDLTIYRKGLNSHTQCTFSCKNVKNLISVPSITRQSLLMNYKFLILPDARMCSEHLTIDNYWPFVKQITCEVATEDQKIISDLMFDYYHNSRMNEKHVFDIDNISSIDNNAFKAWFAFDKNQFQKICDFVKECQPKHVAVFLCKLRTSLSNQQLAFLFGCSERTISNYMDNARKDLLENLVPRFINNNDRTVLLNHNTPMAKILFDIPDENGSCVFDATYRLVQKSKNYAGQKQLWSEQKKMPLMKPMVGCAPDGYILFVLGPFDATHNDAIIFKECFNRYKEIMAIFQRNDVLFVDNGFRDVLEELKDRELLAYIPGTGKRDTLEANKARLVTKVRWIIEQVFGRLKKKFKLFALPAHNATLLHDYESLLIAFALLNLFHEPILSDKTHEDIVHVMKSRLNVPNRLKGVVEQYNLLQIKVPYIELNYTAVDNQENNRLLQFPQLTINDLYYISFGPYQINNAISYYAEHQKEGIFLVQKFEPNPRHYRTSDLDYVNHGIVIIDPLLVKAYMKSRYRSGKNHHIFVLVDKSKSGKDAIVEYYCTCESGSRTVGCCSHIMTIIWYLGYGQYNGIDIPNPDICNVSITIPKKQN